MKHFRLFMFSVPLLIALLVLTAFTWVGTASASTAKVTQSQRALVTCSGNGCNGQDPQTSGCAADARTVQTAVSPDIYVQLRYSPTCGTNWGKTVSKKGSLSLFVEVQHINGLLYSRSAVSTSIYSAMVYAPTTKARACGRSGAGASPLICTAYA